MKPTLFKFFFQGIGVFVVSLGALDSFAQRAASSAFLKTKVNSGIVAESVSPQPSPTGGYQPVLTGTIDFEYAQAVGNALDRLNAVSEKYENKSSFEDWAPMSQEIAALTHAQVFQEDRSMLAQDCLGLAYMFSLYIKDTTLGVGKRIPGTILGGIISNRRWLKLATDYIHFRDLDVPIPGGSTLSKDDVVLLRFSQEVIDKTQEIVDTVNEPATKYALLRYAAHFLGTVVVRMPSSQSIQSNFYIPYSSVSEFEPFEKLSPMLSSIDLQPKVESLQGFFNSFAENIGKLLEAKKE